MLELAKVEDRIEAQLIRQSAEALALENAEQALAMLESGDLTRYVADQFGLAWKVNAKATRFVPGLEAKVRERAFSLPKPVQLEKSLGLVELNEGGAAVISVTNVENGDGSSDLSQGQALQQMLGFQRGRLDFAGAEQTLREEGSISGG